MSDFRFTGSATRFSPTNMIREAACDLLKDKNWAVVTAVLVDHSTEVFSLHEAAVKLSRVNEITVDVARDELPKINKANEIVTQLAVKNGRENMGIADAGRLISALNGITQRFVTPQSYKPREHTHEKRSEGGLYLP